MVDPAALSAGNNIGKIIFSSPEASNSPKEVSVRAATTGATPDSVILSVESPKEGTPLTEEASQGFSAKVKYTLGTKSTAQLSLRVVNQGGVLQGASDFLNIGRSDGTKEVTMTVPAFKIAKGSTKLQLKATMIYAGPTVLATSYIVNYYALYNKLQVGDKTVSSAAGQIAGALGLDVKTVQNATNRVAKFIRI